jgi:hypothetical protein
VCMSLLCGVLYVCVCVCGLRCMWCVCGVWCEVCVVYVCVVCVRLPPDSHQAEGQICRRCADNGAVCWPFPSFGIILTLSTLQYQRDSAADCCHLLTTVVAAVTSDI